MGDSTTKLTPEQALAEAERRIAAARETGAKWLDLGDLTLEELPESLGTLTGLETLALGWVPLDNQGQWGDWQSKRNASTFSNLGPLAGLSALTSLDLMGCKQVGDLGPLAGLSALTSLNLRGCKQVGDLGPLAGLSALTSLDLGGCGQVGDLGPLAGLSALTSLDLWGCGQVGDLGPLLPLSPTLENLILYGCPIDHLPAELLGESYTDNAAPKIRAYFQALEEQEAEEWHQCKVIVLGNGRVGKTSLVKALRGDPHDPNENSTHGIRHWDGQWPVMDGADAVEMNLQFWDFGGQDLFHNTHRLFMRSRAIFVIVWSAQERWDDGEEDDPHRPLQYWLDQVDSLNPKAEVVIVRNKAELKHVAGRHHSLDWREQAEAGHRELTAFEFSAAAWETNKPFREKRDALRLWIGQAALRMLGGPEKRRQPKGRIRVIEALQRSVDWQSTSEPASAVDFDCQSKLLSRAQFADLVANHIPGSSDASDPSHLLDFLHHAGVVYHDAERMPDRIIVDQTWALEGIYTLFDRRRCRDHLTMQEGRFTPSNLRKWAWEEDGYDAEEQALFLSFMESCRIAVQLLRAKETKHGEPLYLAPQYLPTRLAYRERLEQRMAHWGEPAFEFPQLQDRHLGAEAILALLINIGQSFSRKAILWKYGAFIESSKERGEPSAAFLEWTQDDPKQYGGTLVVKIYGAVDAMRSALERELRRLEIIETPEKGDSNSSTIQAVAGSREEVTEGKIAFSVSGLDPERPQIRACADALHAEAIRVFGKDRVVHYANQQSWKTISELMDHIAKTDIVLAVMGKSYLESEYCLLEMNLVSQPAPGQDTCVRDNDSLIIYRHSSGKLKSKHKLFGKRDGFLSERQWQAMWKKRCKKFNAENKNLTATETLRRYGGVAKVAWFMAVEEGALEYLPRFWQEWICEPLPDDVEPETWAREQMAAIRARVTG